MSIPEKYLLRQPPTEDLDESIWGTQPSPEEIVAAQEWNNRRSIELIKEAANELLPSCVKIEGLRQYGINLDINRAREAVRAGSLIAIDMDITEGSLWYPRWQFKKEGDGYFVDQKLLALWRQWGSVQAVAFCSFMKLCTGAESFDEIPTKLQEPSIAEQTKIAMEALFKT